MVLAEVGFPGRLVLTEHYTNCAHSELYRGPLYGCPGHMCATHYAGREWWLSTSRAATLWSLLSRGQAKLVPIASTPPSAIRAVRPWWVSVTPCPAASLAHMLVVIPQPSVQRCIDVHTYTQEGQEEAVQSSISQQRIRGLAHSRSSGAEFSASMVSFMAVVTLTAKNVWYTVSILVVLATRPPMTTSEGYAGTTPGTQSLGAACHRGVGARRRGV